MLYDYKFNHHNNGAAAMTLYLFLPVYAQRKTTPTTEQINP